MFKEKVKANGICRAVLLPTKNGKQISIEEAVEPIKGWLNKNGISVPKKDIVNGNLVVNSGRAKLAYLLGKRKVSQDYPTETSYIDRLQIGDCSFLGTVDKLNNLPSLSDTGLVNEIANQSSIRSGTFTLDPNTDILFPEAVARHPSGTSFPTMAPSFASISNDILTDTSANFQSTGLDPISVLKVDQVTVLGPTNNPIVMGVKEVISPTQLLLHNPDGFSGNLLNYRIDVPGTQVLFTKYIDGNNFSVANGFPSPGAVIVHEAGLLFNDGTLFNRVVFRPDDNNIGVILMAEQANNVKLSVRFEWLVSF